MCCLGFNSKRYDYRSQETLNAVRGELSFNSKRYDYRRFATSCAFMGDWVSIPNGTITGIRHKRTRLCARSVSIPNGTITGARSLLPVKSPLRFQFQTVRLQVGRGILHAWGQVGFNSKRYDYRWKMNAGPLRGLLVSIPNGTITGKTCPMRLCVFR